MSLTVDDKALQTMCTMSEGGKLYNNTDITHTFRPSAPGRALREPSSKGAAVALSNVDAVYAHLFVSLSGACSQALLGCSLPRSRCGSHHVTGCRLYVHVSPATELVLTHLAVPTAQADDMLTLQATLLLESLLTRFSDFRWQRPAPRVDYIIANVRKAAEYVAALTVGVVKAQRWVGGGWAAQCSCSCCRAPSPPRLLCRYGGLPNLSCSNTIRVIMQLTGDAVAQGLIQTSQSVLDTQILPAVVASMEANITDVAEQRTGIALLHAVFAKGTSTPLTKHHIPPAEMAQKFMTARPEALRTKVWEAVITAMHLYGQDDAIQLQGTQLLGMFSPVMPEAKRLEARIACKHAWHFFEARKDRPKVKIVVDAMAVTKTGACAVQ